ncbi:hypothetical protein [Pilimelia terevasa]|uniref:hypothetical protein n=1 Tax=Pilimelia terevasa TaxID=53372 RepID=UPI00166BC58F|nr:hypothetical protein [Pilimelia terevasa]
MEITPPVSATPAATVALWRLLATLLAAPTRLGLVPARLVWEVHADPAGLRVGVWVPAGINPTAVARVLDRAWPGVRTTHTAPPPTGRAAVAVAGRQSAVRADWMPITNLPAPSRTGRWEVARSEDDPLRAVYGGLAAAGRTGGGLLQIIAGRAPARRLAAIRAAISDPRRAHHPSTPAARSARLVVDVLSGLLRTVLDLITPGPSRSPSPAHHTHASADPYAAEIVRQARAKLADGPHLVLCLRAVAWGPTREAARAAASDITAGFAVAAHQLTWRRLRRPGAAAVRRWVPPARMLLGTSAETAAVAGLPAEPAAHGLPAAASRRRPGVREMFQPPPQRGAARAGMRVTAPAHPQQAGSGPRFNPTITTTPRRP